MKQFSLKNKVFDDLIADENGNLHTWNKDWIRISSQDEINAISAAITSEGAIWLDETGQLKTSPPRPSLSHEWDNKSQIWHINPELAAQLKAEQQSQMWARIKQKRHDNLRSGVYVKSVGKWLHNDDDSRAQYTFMRTMATLPENMLWKTMDNRFIPMTRELLDELSMQLLLDEQADFANAERHRAAMLQADNPLDYDYSSGWTATFQD